MDTQTDGGRTGRRVIQNIYLDIQSTKLVQQYSFPAAIILLEVKKVTERVFIIKANHKDVFIHKMHIKMANMDKQETPPCLIAL